MSTTIHNILQCDNSVHFHGNTKHFHIFDSYVYVNNIKTTYCCVPITTMVRQTCHNVLYMHCLPHCLLITIPDNQKEKFKSFVLIIVADMCLWGTYGTITQLFLCLFPADITKRSYWTRKGWIFERGSTDEQFQAWTHSSTFGSLPR